MSIDAIQWLVAKYATRAALACPSLLRKDVSPHVLRHTCAMNLLRHGVDISVIALWLGHYVGDRRSPALRHIMRDHAGDLRRMVKLLDRPTAEHPHIKHESVQTTQIYLQADLELKERALRRTAPPTAKPGRYRAPDKLFAFLAGC